MNQMADLKKSWETFEQRETEVSVVTCSSSPFNDHVPHI